MNKKRLRDYTCQEITKACGGTRVLYPSGQGIGYVYTEHRVEKTNLPVQHFCANITHFETGLDNKICQELEDQLPPLLEEYYSPKIERQARLDLIEEDEVTSS